MGLAASQARLLSITRRMSDNELRAQLINNQKMRLATESSRVSENYINALNSSNLMFSNYAADNSMQTIPLTYNALTAFNQYNNQYILSDVAGSVFLREDEVRLYAQSNGDLDEYLSLHGIEYTTTYWDVVGANFADDAAAVNEAAVIRAWYETAGINAMSSVSGIEGCSMFPTLFTLAERINNVYEAVNTSSERRTRLINQAVSRITSGLTNDAGDPCGCGGHSNKWFFPSGDDNWLTLHANGANPTAQFSLDACNDWFLKQFINVGEGTNPSPTDFKNIYTALWNFGNGQPFDLESLSGTDWYDTLLPYVANSNVINLETFFGGGTAPSHYETELFFDYSTPQQSWSDYLFCIQEYNYQDEMHPDIDNGTARYIRLPGQGEVLIWEERNDNYGTYSYNNPDFIEYSSNGYNFYKWINNQDGKTYYIPSNVTSYNNLNNQFGGCIIVGDENGEIPSDISDILMGNTPDRVTKANEWIQELITDYINKQLTKGNRIESLEQYQHFGNGVIDCNGNQHQGMGFTDEEIEIINNPVDDMGFSDLVEEFFNIFLGSPNGANDWLSSIDNNAHVALYNDQYINIRRERALQTINEIINNLIGFEIKDLTSTAFDSGIDPNDILFGDPNEVGGDYQTVLDNIWATMVDNTGVIRNYDWAGEYLPQYMQVFFQNYTNPNIDEGHYYYGDMTGDGSFGGHLITSDLKSELIYAAAADFFSHHGMPVYGYMKNGEDATAEAEWYKNLFNKIQECGYKELERGLASSTDWMKYALENGIGIIEQLNTVNGWNKITYNSCSDITEETNSQRATLAEAQYNKAMNQIQAKDERFDLELKNIDTEHTSLQQEYESVKKAMEQNVQRTFKLYS